MLCCTASTLACSEMSPAGRLVQDRDGRSSSKKEVDNECGKKTAEGSWNAKQLGCALVNEKAETGNNC